MWLVDYPRLLFLALFLIFAIALEIGFRLASIRNANVDADLHEQAVGVRDGVVVLLSLLLGFTLAMALPRFDQRRELIVDEANAIGTSTLRAQTLPEPARTVSIELLREYCASRIDFFDDSASAERLNAATERAHQIQASLWQLAVDAAAKNPTPITSIYITSLNEMISIVMALIADLDTPNRGLIRVSQESMLRLQSDMQATPPKH